MPNQLPGPLLRGSLQLYIVVLCIPLFSVNVQLFSPRKGDLTAMVLQEMRAMLETQFEIEDRILTVNICDRLININPNMAVLVLCINASRLGSDVASALEGLTCK